MGQAGIGTTTSVLIVGAGPTGLAAAVELGSRGIDCVIVDPRAEVSHRRPRGKTTHARTMEHFRRWGIAAEVRAASATPPASFHDVAYRTSLLGPEIHRFRNALGMFPTPPPELAETGVFVGQPRVEQVLRRKVAMLPSVQTLYGWRATGDISAEAHSARIEVADPSGAPGLVEAGYVIVADGPRSSLRGPLGIRLDGGDYGDPAVSVMFRAPSLWALVERQPAVTYWCLNRRATGNLWPYDPAQGLWVAGTQDIRAGAQPESLIAALVGERVEMDVISVDVWQARRAVADRYREGRFFLVGDAARQTPPWGGHGYNTCVLDAVDLAWKLAAVLDGWADETLLDTYEIERRPVAEYVIDSSTRNMRVLGNELFRDGIESEGDAGAAVRSAVAREIEAAKRAEFYSLGLVLGYNYAHSPAVVGADVAGARSRQPADGTVYEPSFAAGSRLPHTWLEGGRSLYDLLGGGFTLLLGRDAADAAAMIGAARRRRVPLTILTSAQLPDSYDRPQYVVVRPDQHITWSADRLDVPAEAVWNAATGKDIATRTI